MFRVDGVRASGLNGFGLAISVIASILMVVSGQVAADPFPLGLEFVVNTTASELAEKPAIAVADTGGFIVFWLDAWSPNPIDIYVGIRARSYGPSGSPSGNDVVFQQYPTGGGPGWIYNVSLERISATACPNGNFVTGIEQTVASYSLGDPPEYYNSFSSVRSDPAAFPLGVTILDTGDISIGNYIGGISVASRADSSLAVTWGGQNYSAPAPVLAQRFLHDGTAIGSTVTVHPDYSSSPKVAASTSTSNFVSVWSSETPVGNDLDGSSIQACHFLADGTPSANLQVNTDTPGDQLVPSVAMSPWSHAHLVAWRSGCDIRARAFDADSWASPAGNEVTVFAGTSAECATNPAVAAMSDGTFVVVWEVINPTSGLRPILGRQLSNTAVLLGSPLEISTQIGLNTTPGISATPGNGFIVTWRFGDSLPAQSIVARQFVSPKIFTDDFESAGLSRWTSTVESLADMFNNYVVGRGIVGDYIQCSYDVATDTYTYLGTDFSGATGALGGGPIVDITDLYWKNEDLASTVSPYDSEDADGDSVINSLDADALNSADW
jgi:hypothetical protein